MWKTGLKFVLGIWLIATFTQHVQADYPGAYVGKAELRDLAISPDGKRLALLKTGHEFGFAQRFGWDEIEITDSATGDTELKLEQGYTYTSKSTNWLYDWVYWPFDDVILANAVEFTVSRKKFKTRSVFLRIDPETGEKKILSSSRKGKLSKELEFPKLIAHNAGSREVALAVPNGSRTDLTVINVDTGHSRIADSTNGQVLTWFLGDQMRPVMRVEKSKSGALHLYYASNDNGRTWQLRFQHDFLNEGFRPISYVQASNSFIVLARPGNAERAGLYEFSLATGQFTHLLFEHQSLDLYSARVSGETDALIYASYWDDKLEKHWFDDGAAKLGRAIDKALPDETNWSLYDLSENGSGWVIFISSPTNPGAFYVLRKDIMRLRKVSDTRPHVNLKSTSMPVRIDYKAADGLPLRGYFTPSIHSSENAPLIVMPHGGPVSRDRLDWDGWAQYFAFRGYSVFQPQFRGSDGFGRTFVQLGYGEWGKAMQQDIADGVSALEHAGLVRPDAPRSIVGASYGGYAALAAGTMTPDAYQCVVSYAGVSDLPRFMRQYGKEDPLDVFSRKIWMQRINNGDEDEGKLWHRSPISYIDYLKAPVFLIHGTEDEIVYPEQTVAFHEAALNAGKSSQILLLEETGHQIYSDDTNADLLVAMNSFLVKCMPPAIKSPDIVPTNIP